MSNVAFKIYRETAMPSTLEPYSVYLIAPSSKPDYVEFYVTNSDASVTKRIINDADIQAMIDASLASINELVVVDDIAARDALSPTNTLYVYVKDATGDPTVDSGGATYIYDTSASSWVKVSESESMDVTLAWADITGKPTSTPAQIDAAVANSHTHSNKTQLDKIGEDGDGNLTYDGDLPLTRWETVGW